ncbi:MAG: LytR/AlgR family response regulator transcription factor [Mariniphaga sp.]
MNVVIIEDERLAADKLASFLKQIDSEVKIAARLESVGESVDWLINNAQPDLIFMDIQLDDGISFEIFESVKIDVPVIFTTAFDQYAIRAFKVNSIDYLLKPVDKEALKGALEKYRKIHAPANVDEKISKVFEQLVTSWKTRFFIKVGNHFQSVPVGEIVAFFVEERCTFLRTSGGKNYALDYSLDQLQKKINPSLFFLINRSFIINIEAISEIISYSTTRLKIKLNNFTDNGMIVSRDKAAEFKQWLDR